MIIGQLLRFIIVGTASNAILYCIYWIARDAGVCYEIAMTIAFSVGIVQTFILNKKWSFRDTGDNAPAFVRYVLVYLVAYVIDLASLAVLVERYHFSDRLVQAGMIVVVAAFLFLMQRTWVFSNVRSYAGK